MKKYWTLFIAFATTLTASCSTNTTTGMFTITGLGSGIGVLAGGSKGAWIGSATGFLAGSLIGLVLDEQDRKVMEQSSPRTVYRMDKGESLTINDVIKLSQSGINDDTTLTYLKDSGSTYNLTKAQIRRLQEAGVSQRVINYMIQTKKT